MIEILRRGHHSQVTSCQKPRIALEGTVAHPSALDQLRDDLTREFGQDAVHAMLADVRIQAEPTPVTDESQ